MFAYDLTSTPGGALYERLTACIRRDIGAGRLPAGTRLPSKRQAAADLGVSVVTVMGAYDQLLAEGYIVSRPRRGYYVADVASDTLPAAPRAVPAAPRSAETRAEPAPVFDLAGNTVPRGLFPFTAWSRLSRRVYADLGDRLMERVPYNGLPALREAIAAGLLGSRGIRTDADCVLISAGNEWMYAQCLSFLGRERVYGVEDPGYPLIARLYRENGAVVKTLPMDGAGVMPSALEASGTEVLHISPNHHFPTGVVMPIGRRQELLAWLAADSRRIIIEDDYDSEFRLSGRPIPSLQSMDRTGRVIYINTFTKTVAPSLRVGYGVLSPAMAEAYRARFGFLSCPVAVPEQYMLAAFLADGSLTRHVDRVRTRCRAVRDALLEALAASPRRERFTVSRADGGLFFLLRIETDLSDGELCRAAGAAGIRVRSLGDYCAVPPSADTHTLLINYAGLSAADAPALVRRLDTVG